MSVMTSVAAISVAEVGAVQSGVALDVREDGRTLVQRRPVSIHVGARGSFHLGSPGSTITDRVSASSSTSASAAVSAQGSGVVVVDGAELYDGNAVSLTVGETTVLATASPSVIAVPVHECSMDHTSNNNTDTGNDVTAFSRAEVAPDDAAHASGNGVLAISIDVVPSVVDLYAHALGGNSRRYRRVYLDHLAHIIRQVFGAQYVTTQEVSGVAEADVLRSDSDNDKDVNNEEDDGGTDHMREAHGKVANGGSSSNRNGPHVGFPSQDLYIGKGFAFRVDVDVHVLQALAGNLLSHISMAVHCALRTFKLPAVTLHETAAGVSVEMDRTKPYRAQKDVDWSQLPLLTTLLLSPTRHYVVDATLREELAMPQQLHVAATAAGQVCFIQYQTLPSRRGHALHPAVASSVCGAAVSTESNTEGNITSHKRGRDRADEGASGVGGATTTGQGEAQSSMTPALTHTAELHLSDWVHSVSDAVHICQAMVSECGDMIAPSYQAVQ